VTGEQTVFCCQCWQNNSLTVYALSSLESTQAVVMQEEEVDRRYHIIITAQGAATHWQARVHYYWYKKVSFAI